MNSFPLLALLSALAGSLALGGGIYECALIDRVWPRLPVLVQPGRGGINRKLFWGPVHGLFELTLIAALWESWHRPELFTWVTLALALHLAARIWSFAYFIPKAIQFEQVEQVSPSLAKVAMTWVSLSWLRVLIEAAAVVALAAGIVAASSH